jgi:hypothetical protein
MGGVREKEREEEGRGRGWSRGRRNPSAGPSPPLGGRRDRGGRGGGAPEAAYEIPWKPPGFSPVRICSFPSSLVLVWTSFPGEEIVSSFFPLSSLITMPHQQKVSWLPN